MLSVAGLAEAGVCTSVQSGNWNTTSTWSCTGGITRPSAGHDAIIVSPHTVTLDGDRSATNLQINVGATLSDGNARNLTLSGNAVINGTYDATGNNGDLIMTGNGVTLSGAGTIIDINRIDIDGAVTIPAGSNISLTLGSEIRVGNNNAGTLTIDGTLDGTGMNNGTRLIRLDNGNTSNMIVNGTIDAPQSYVEVQSGGTVTNNGTVSLQYLDGNNNATSSWVQGPNSNLTLTKPAVQWVGTFNASAVGNTVTFNGTATPFNPATYYNIAGVGVTCPPPAGITVLGSSPCGVTVSSITLASPNPATTGSTVSWTVAFSQTVTGVTAAKFSLVQSGGVTGATITSVTAGAGATWTVAANTGSGFGTLGLNMVNVTGIAPAVTSVMPVVGAVYSIDAPMTCVTDNFSTGALDTTLWSVRTIMGAFTPQVVNVGGGDYRLRLTDTGGNEATFAQLKRTFPGAGNKVVLEIDYFAYGGSGADGIAVTFSDSTISSTTGGFGGSLGYAPNGANAGFGGGWLGIGLDEYGNFPNPTEGRSGYPVGWTAPVTANTAAGFYKTNVSVRGSGSGATGYALLANTGVLATAVAPPTGAAGDTPYRFRFTLDHSDNVHAYVTVERDTTGTGNSYATLVPKFDVKGANSGQSAVPANWLVSFTGSTGGATNNHDFKRVRVCANTILGGGPHHFEIQHADGQGVTCTPSTLTIKACADASCVTPYTAGVSGSLSATGTPTVNWGGGSNAFTIPAGSSTVTKSIQVTTVGSVTLDATSTPAPTAASSCTWGSCSFTSANSALLVSAPNHLAESASTLTIQAVKAAPSNPLVCVPGMTGTKTVNLKCGYTNPSSGTQAVRVGGAALNAGNNTAAACDAGGANVSLTFNASGIATPSLQYADVGQMSVSASYTGTTGIDTGLVMTGSGSFITAPASFSVTGVTAGPIKAGRALSATVTALNAAGVATLNFGNENAPEGATLSSVLAMGAGTWTDPALSGTTAVPGTSFVNGVATVSDLTWGEVGAINLSAALTSGNYLTSGLTTASGTTATSTTFIPDHYTTEIVSAGGAPMTCPDVSCPANALGVDGMVYSGQPFTVKVTAKNLSGTTTSNYHDAYAQDVTLSGVSAAAGSLSNPLLLASNFAAGVATTTSLPAFTFTAAGPALPSDVTIHAVGTSVSSAIVSAAADESALKVAYGRIKLSNAYGSELLPLTSGATAQYFGTTGWVNSLTDNSTVLGLAASYAVGTGATSPTPQNVTMANGKLVFGLSKPGVKGVATITPSAHAYMGLVAGTATFGVYKGTKEFIYLRESY